MTENSPHHIDRLSIRERPGRLPIMRQNWGKLLFMHWPIPAASLRPLIPARLSIDTFEGRAWVGVVPFTMWGVRPSFTPPAPGLSALHELNVRTYVHLDGVPGVWFFSLDANSAPAVWGARTFFHLPYFNARISLRQEGQNIFYDSHRTHGGAPPADFSASWTFGEPLTGAEPGSLVFFLTERYCLYAARRDRLYRCRIFHPPWPLRRAEVSSFRSTMVESHGLPTPPGEPLLHYAEALKVDVWPLVRV
ncbi:MAG: YqjF family protein [Pyrinomonadaceae bacterium]